MTWLRKWIPRIYMLGTYFWVLIYLISKYSTVEVVEETKRSMPIPILIVLIILIAILGFGGFVILIISWIDKIKQDKFSFYTFAPISVLMITTIGITMLAIHKLKILLELNVAQFITDLEGYNTSLLNVGLILLSGLIIGGIGKILEA